MKTSVIQWPRSDRFICIRQSILTVTNENVCAAALIAFFERWHNFRLEQQEHESEHHNNPIVDKSGWQYHTNKQLVTGVLIYKIEAIDKAINLLESLNFVSTAVPPELQILYETGRTRWFLLRNDIINDYFIEHAEKIAKPKVLILKPAIVIEKKPPSRNQVLAIKIHEYRNKARGIFWLAKGRKLPITPVSTRSLQLIVDRLNEKFTCAQLCMAVEGNLSSDFHQGDNDRKEIYDSVAFVFKDADRINRLITIAAKHGINEETVNKRFTGTASITTTNITVDYEPISKYLSELVVVQPLTLHNVRIVKAMCGVGVLDFRQLALSIIPRIERSVGMYSSEHKIRLNDFAKLYKEQ